MKDPLPRAIIKKKNAYEKGNRNDDTPAFSSRKKPTPEELDEIRRMIDSLEGE